MSRKPTNNKPAKPANSPAQGNNPITKTEKNRIIKSIIKAVLHMFTVHDGGICDIDVRVLDADMGYQRDPGMGRLSKNWDPEKVGVLTVSYRDGKLYVVDGWHRVILARFLGIQYLPAMVFTDWSREKEIEHFLSQMKGITPLKPVDTFSGRLLLDDPVDTIIDRVCKAYNIRVGRSFPKQITRKLTTLGAARTVVASIGEEGFEWIMELLDNTKWLQKPKGITHQRLIAFGHVYLEGVREGCLDAYTERMQAVISNISSKQFDGCAAKQYPYEDFRSAAYDLAIDIARGNMKLADVMQVVPADTDD